MRPSLPSEDSPVVIDVDDVTMVFNIASEQLNSLKEYFVHIAKHDLLFKEFKALEHIDFKVHRGEAFGLVGTNGSGKSTMLKIIAGVLEASKGTCTVVGSIAPLIELGAGFDMELTATENIYLNGALLGYSKDFIDSRFDQIVEFAELGEFMEMPLKNYSSGMVARIAFAIATVTEPDILIVDEALSVGDFIFQQKCERRIKELVDSNNVTVLLVSHSIDLVERMCDRVCWIEKGHQRMVGPTDEVCEAYRNMGRQIEEAQKAEENGLVTKDVDDSSETDE
ncbi:MAG: ABC transporter ATP-binding protein [Atopobiaceae bacterium]|jgi:ABC-2 type transport system ATP-binding protein|nr:ABC transporter ATP-binding protein [Atopobiaceae bacterium]MCH4180938.1 ABC transporter ATP-binding protein [Atopobiaceae bacterium]MCH4214020.1 ABC transporter ATP-binding protein [Atopobiaceae bacterium]MCH4229583.1 ABC transporter ATP-binding protein [Atopobiaceae bacterium]MCH4276866.1 ABC transporter ATP-binding protein [Atopobiaceae bacterium]